MSVSGDNRGGAEGTHPLRSIGLDLVREAGDWSDFEPLEPAVEAAAAALATLTALGAPVSGAPVSGTPVSGTPVSGLACVVLSSNAHVRQLNAAWRGIDTATNVLSFPAAPQPAGAADRGPVFLGDIVLAAETLLREAAADAIPARDHLQHLVIHGLLHLLGYDHESEADAEVMEALEVAALASLGVASPYHDRELHPDAYGEGTHIRARTVV